MHVVSRYSRHHDIRVEMNLMKISNAILQPEGLDLVEQKITSQCEINLQL